MSMTNFTHFIRIKNFKSVKQIDLDDCKRINLFIGKPNVGKSNLLEAISLFSLTYLGFVSNDSIQQFVRVENDSELFYDGNIHDLVNIESSIGELTIEARPFGFVVNQKGLSKRPLEIPFSRLVCSKRDLDVYRVSPYKCYVFPSSFEKEKSSLNFLLPPHGGNLMSVVSQLPALKEELKTIFDDYGLRYVFDANSQEIKIIKEKTSGEIFLIPFHSIADTLQRLIFYKAAVESNTDSILTFEEPEAHAYPPYISRITQSIIAAETNQFFISTHSPYVVTDFLEHASKELALWLVYYEEGQTKVKRLTDSELNEVYEYGVDLFFNTETYLK